MTQGNQRLLNFGGSNHFPADAAKYLQSTRKLDLGFGDRSRAPPVPMLSIDFQHMREPKSAQEIQVDCKVLSHVCVRMTNLQQYAQGKNRDAGRQCPSFDYAEFIRCGPSKKP